MLIEILLPSRARIGFRTKSDCSGSKDAGSKYLLSGNRSQRIARIVLFERSIFHGGSSHTVEDVIKCCANSSWIIHSHG